MKAKLASELFSQAIGDGNLERVKDLVLNQGYDINMIDAHNQPMFTRAILSQNMDIINFFFEQNADINPTCAEGKYIFMRAELIISPALASLYRCFLNFLN